MEGDDVERVALSDGVDGFECEEIVVLAAPADGVDIISASDVDGLLVEADALHAVDQIYESGFFHSCDFGSKHVLQLAVGCHE